jgi:flagellar basal body-associated protein FliL
LRVTTPKKRNRAITILMLPAAVFMFVVGWAFFWIGHQQKVLQKTQPARQKDSVTLRAALDIEEPQEISA